MASIGLSHSAIPWPQRLGLQRPQLSASKCLYRSTLHWPRLLSHPTSTIRPFSFELFGHSTSFIWPFGLKDIHSFRPQLLSHRSLKHLAKSRLKCLGYTTRPQRNPGRQHQSRRPRTSATCYSRRISSLSSSVGKGTTHFNLLASHLNQRMTKTDKRPIGDLVRNRKAMNIITLSHNEIMLGLGRLM